jgi:Zn-finger nucleic acid-binding protein
MNCPNDCGVLTNREVGGAAVALCARCGGMFLAPGELNRVAGHTAGDLEYSTVDLDTFQHDDDHGPVACPANTSHFMKKVEFNILSNIILDFCDECGGFWLDGRELLRIREEVNEYNEVEREGVEPWTVRLSRFFWGLPFPH